MKLKRSPIYFALCSLLPSLGWAEMLEEIEVSALRDPTEYAQTQNKIERLDRNQLEETQATSVAQAISSKPNISISGGSRPLGQKVNIRGLSGTRVVQVIDGVRQNFNLEHRGSYFLPPSTLGQIEVVKGPSSALWGSGALGGVMAMRTLNAFDLLKNNEHWGVLVKQGYQSASSLSETQVAAYGANEKFDVLVQGFHNKSNNLRLGESLGELPYSGLTQQGGLLKAGWQINETNRLELNFRHTVNKQLAPANNEMAEPYTPIDFFDYVKKSRDTGGKVDYSEAGGTTDLAQQKIVDTGLSLRYLFNPESDWVNSELTLYTNRTKETEQNQRTLANDETRYRTWGFNFRNTSEFERAAFIYGVDFYQDHAITSREKNNADACTGVNTSAANNGGIPVGCEKFLGTAKYRPNPYNAKANVWGTYLLSHLKLAEQWTLSPALRFDHYKTSEVSSQSYQKSHLSPALTLSYQPTDWFDINVKYNEAFRAPSLQERYVSGNHFGYDRMLVTSFQSNPDLKPEVARNKEINFNFHWQNLWKAEDSLKISTALFQNDVKDFINLEVIKYNDEAKNIPEIFQYRNVQNARLRGVEFSTEYQTPSWSLYANYGMLRGKDRQTGEALENINADRIIVGGNYAVVADKFSVGGRLSHYFAQKRLPSKTTQEYPAYTLVDLTATYAPKQGEWENLRVDFAIENLFDKAYTQAFSLTPSAGRNVKVSVAYQF
ncbi:TonB-dependent hemoglobin/transferrin/lactoferrin family receptor [Gallibacterium sp. ZY190522]